MFTRQGFGSGGAAEVASMRRDQGLPSCWTDSIADGSKMEPPEVKAVPISNTGEDSVKTDLRKGKTCCAAALGERSKKNVRETALQTPRPVKEEEEEVLQKLEQRFPGSPW